MTANKGKISEWQAALANKEAEDIVKWANAEFRGRVAFASSLGLEDQVITDIIATNELDVPVLTLDTGRLFPESYDLIQKIKDHYGIDIQVFFPDATEVEAMVREHGVNLFYHSVENRKLCCGVRKIHPLQRALSDVDAWITGLRQEQSAGRSDTPVVEWDAGNGLVKINPLAAWSEDDVRAFVSDRKVPYNVLHDQGYPSIGCSCCTRKIESGEDIRSGRWWWETDNRKECGLHVVDGKLVRSVGGPA